MWLPPDTEVSPPCVAPTGRQHPAAGPQRVDVRVTVGEG